jgi:hypothetical protein
LGLANCCLNWCVSPKVDRDCRERLNISPTEKILTFLAIGYADEKAVVPLFVRRPTNNICNYSAGIKILGSIPLNNNVNAVDPQGGITLCPFFDQIVFPP